LNVAILAALIVAVMLLAVLVAAQLRGGGSGDELHRQLVEVRARLDTLAASQRDVPAAVTAGSLEQARSLADVRERLGQLADATRRLEEVGRAVGDVRELLKVPRLRGTLGEVWLEELLRQVFPGSLYATQYGFSSGEKVDAVLRVGGRLVPIDSKFPLDACQRMLAADGPEADRERRAFRRALRLRIDEVAAKYIRPDEGTFDFAMMYVPAENVYYEAVVRGEDLDDDGSVVGYALNRRVIIVSPNTFYAYLSALVHGLRGLAVEERAREILDSIGGLEQQFARFQRSHDIVGRHLENAFKQYGESQRELARIQHRFAHLTGVDAPAEPALPRRPEVES
jgi:DNA recombination protein RmuC